MQAQSDLLDISNDYISIKDASKWASNYLQKNITVSNISYLIQYGKINRYGSTKKLVLSIKELENYYSKLRQRYQVSNDADWDLSFSQYKESETTKHVHRLHPYKGKFIPQLVEHFLKLEVNASRVFNSGDIILDPFCGSGTTLVQANECNMHAIGIDVSGFNVMISNAKVDNYIINKLAEEGTKITEQLIKFQINQSNLSFEQELSELLAKYNNKYFNGAEYRIKVRDKAIDEKDYATDKENKLLKEYQDLIIKHKIQILQDKRDTFLGTWFVFPVMCEIDFVFQQIDKINDSKVRKILGIILSRTIRSCRATSHSDLGTLKEPITVPYYCKKHYKLCRPIFSINNWWQRYLSDTISRISQFQDVRSDTYQTCLAADSRDVDIFNSLDKTKHPLASLARKNKIKGILSSPPYVGLINYHEQHAYSYELFNFGRQDDLEIGPLFRGQGLKAKESYKIGVADVLNNSKRFLQNDYDIFLVANDKHGLYPDIAKLAGMQIVKSYKRPVLNRVEKDRGTAYYEQIFHLKQGFLGFSER